MSFPSWATVVSLLFACRPYAIAGFVMAVVVLTLNCFAGCRVLHVGKKVFKTFAPTFAYPYSATPVVFVSCVISVITTVFHHGPNAVKFCAAHAVCFSSRTSKFAIKAAAGLGVAANDIPHLCVIPFAAITNKYAVISAVGAALLGNTKQPPEFLAYMFSFSWHKTMLKQYACNGQAGKVSCGWVQR